VLCVLARVQESVACAVVDTCAWLDCAIQLHEAVHVAEPCLSWRGLGGEPDRGGDCS
jgi:hypothetical protein